MREELSSMGRSRAIAELAGRQHGVVASRQLEALGWSTSAIGRLVAAGRLHRVHRGVYAVGHRVLPADGHRLAAVLACGDAALASHATAAAIWGLRHGTGRLVQVTVGADRGHRSRAGIRVHRAGDLTPADHALVRAIPVTSVARTLADLGDVAPATHVRSAFAAAERIQLLDMAAIDAALSAAGTRRRGPRILGELLRAHDPRWSQTRSDLELAMLDLLEAHDLPAGEVNAWVAGRYVADILWPDRRLVVEVDSDRYHRSPSARRADARRDHDLRRLGYQVLRITEHDLADEPRAVAQRLRRALAVPTSARPS
jgi:very-short-patch-repair endonuclease/predicted transcriptional regulator of viral defense system